MPANPISRPVRTRSLLAVGIVLSTAALTSGCAQQREEGYYDQSAAGSLSDAEYQASGAGYRSAPRAPSQVQIVLKPSERNNPANRANQEAAPADAGAQAQPVPLGEQAPATPPDTRVAADGPRMKTAPAPRPVAGVKPELAKLVPQAQTFLGTLPCQAASMQCSAQRFVLTLAPNGLWRARSSYLESAQASGKPIAEQGCWSATAEKPPRVMLLDNKGNSRAEFTMAANNVLTVRDVAGVRPNLTYHLTRQPDLDPIGELGNAPQGSCE
jgi:hypothetical protein